MEKRKTGKRHYIAYNFILPSWMNSELRTVSTFIKCVIASQTQTHDQMTEIIVTVPNIYDQVAMSLLN